MSGAIFGSNPCRVRHGTQELVFFRNDIEKCMRRQCLMSPSGKHMLQWQSLPHDTYIPMGLRCHTLSFSSLADCWDVRATHSWQLR